ncbi:hypothetical protein FGG08_000311 [Glutinoglossum americanum]|uniref:J domain-containing protein n=1 Tax=Glutinoglossum americanum TaxID=1670608 RepID=A0A9P8IGR3_9PEZI|nr:hypothetical protein FGG08_000311 [Glutinoglossum americanum]
MVRNGAVGDEYVPPRKKFKTSDLPLPAATRSAIDGLVHTFKKKGEFDKLRKHLWGKFTESNAKASFTSSLTELAESEIDRDPSLLARDRGKAATLIEGAVDRTDIYKTVDAEIDALINENLAQIEATVRAVRREEIGEASAADEERRGNKTEDDYAREAEEKRRERERIREMELERQREVEREKERIHERELEKQREEERQKEREKEELRALEREKERKREAEREREKELRRIKEREAERELERQRKVGCWGGDEKVGKVDVVKELEMEIEKRRISLPPEAAKALDEEALELLLKEGQEHSAKAKQRPEPERSASLEPPPRKTQRPSSNQKATKQDDNRGREVRVDKPSSRRDRSRDSHHAATRRHSRDNDRDATDRSRPRSRDRDRRRDGSRGRRNGRSRSPSRISPTQQHGERRKADPDSAGKEFWRAQQQAIREREADAYKQAQREQRERGEARGPAAMKRAHRPVVGIVPQTGADPGPHLPVAVMEGADRARTPAVASTAQFLATASPPAALRPDGVVTFPARRARLRSIHIGLELGEIPLHRREGEEAETEKSWIGHATLKLTGTLPPELRSAISMANEDLKAHATSSHDFYALLSITPETPQHEIRRAYRKTALKYHPDKHPDDPSAIETFHLLQIAYDVLSDPAIKALYDNARIARAAKARQSALLDGERRRMKEDLERREQGSFGGVKRKWDEEDPEEKLEREIRRLQEDGARRRREREEMLRREKLEEEEKTDPPPPEPTAPDTEPRPTNTGGTNVPTISRTIKARWPRSSSPPLTPSTLRSLFSKYGPIENAILLKDKKLRMGESREKKIMATGVVEFQSIVGAYKAVEDAKSGRGGVGRGVESVSWAGGSEPAIVRGVEELGLGGGKTAGGGDSPPSTPSTPSRPPPKFSSAGLSSTPKSSTTTSSNDGNGNNNNNIKRVPSFASFTSVGGNTPQGSPFDKGPQSPSLEEVTLIRLRNAERKRLEEEIRRKEAGAEAEGGGQE